MLEAARALGRQDDLALRSASLELAAYSSSYGFDTVRGGFFEIGTPAGVVTDFDKVWWVQFEALAGLWWAYELSGDLAHLDRLTATLGWIESTEDRPSGEWFATTNPDGTAAGLDYKGDEYKASYHTLRALLFVKDWIDAELARHAAP
jgi:mannobiose 2-epimerase